MRRLESELEPRPSGAVRTSRRPGRRDSPGPDSGRKPIWLLAALVMLLALAGCARSSDDGNSIEVVNGNADPDVGTVPGAAKEIFAKPPYEAARWTYLVEDLETGEVSLAKDAGVMAQTGSTAKLFTIGSAYETFGPDHTITTPVYGLGSREGHHQR